MPTPEEWLSYVIRKLESEGLSDLLRWYLMWYKKS